MTTSRSNLTDAQLRQGLTELAAGPAANELVADVLRTVDVTPQARGFWWRPESQGRRAVAVLALGVLLVALVGAIAVFSGILPLPVPAPFAPQTIVVQQWNDLRGDEFQITHSAVAPTGEPADGLLDALPADAGFVRWSPDGQWLTYIEVEAPADRRGYAHTGLVLARADGSDPISISTPRAVDMYDASGWFNGAYWAPSSGLFALGWNTHGCSGGPDCIPDAGIDIFDTAGQRIAAIPTPDVPALQPVWSPDSERIGWLTGACADGLCVDDTFHWRLIEGDETIHTLMLGSNSGVVWSTSDRLLVVTSNVALEAPPTVERVYSVAPDGTDELDVVLATAATGIPVWSPDGRQLAIADPEAGLLTIRDAASGADVVVATPTGLGVAMWSPSSDRMVLYGGLETSSLFALYTINADGTRLNRIGEAWDFSWMPTPPTGGPSPSQDASVGSPALEPGAVRAVEDFVRPFTYRFPPGETLSLVSRSHSTPMSLYTMASGVRYGVEVFVVEGVIHPCVAQFPAPTPQPGGGQTPFDTITISSSPEGYLQALHDVAGVGIGPISATSVDGFEAFTAEIDPARSECSGTTIHAQGMGLSYAGFEPELDTPAKIWVVDVDSVSIGIRAWARDAVTFAEWLPRATVFVKNVDFTDAP
jgi:hypothetical protein